MANDGSWSCATAEYAHKTSLSKAHFPRDVEKLVPIQLTRVGDPGPTGRKAHDIQLVVVPLQCRYAPSNNTGTIRSDNRDYSAHCHTQMNPICAKYQAIPQALQRGPIPLNRRDHFYRKKEQRTGQVAPLATVRNEALVMRRMQYTHASGSAKLRCYYVFLQSYTEQ